MLSYINMILATEGINENEINQTVVGREEYIQTFYHYEIQKKYIFRYSVECSRDSLAIQSNMKLL